MHLSGLKGKLRKTARNAYRRKNRRMFRYDQQIDTNNCVCIPNDCWAIVVGFLNDVDVNRFGNACNLFRNIALACKRFVYHPNVGIPFHSWTLKDIGKSSNPKCAVESECCTEKMSDVRDLCHWHRQRMAQYEEFKCNCNEWIVCCGDSPGRRMFRNYYDNWDIPVSDLTYRCYCCGDCQNGDTEKYLCGNMLVGDCCKHRHRSKHLFPIILDSSSDEEYGF